MTPVRRPVLLALFLVLAGMAVSPLSVWAADDATAQTHDEAVKTTAGKFVQDLGDRAIGIIANKNITVDQRSEKFRQILSDSFDLMTIGRFVIGRSWNSATPEQQKEYMRLFEALVVRSYGEKLTLYTGEGFTVTGSRPESEKDIIVKSQITHPDGSEPTVIDWRIRKKDNKLGVIDVMVEGVSLSVTQRQEYSSIIQNNGGQIEPLLKMMQQQLATPAGQPANGAG